MRNEKRGKTSTSRSLPLTSDTADLQKRLDRHNNGGVLSTRKGKPWGMIASYAGENRSEAMLLESKIKKRGAKRFLEER